MRGNALFRRGITVSGPSRDTTQSRISSNPLKYHRLSRVTPVRIPTFGEYETCGGSNPRAQGLKSALGASPQAQDSKGLGRMVWPLMFFESGHEPLSAFVGDAPTTRRTQSDQALIAVRIEFGR